jgi:ABC-type Fe3+-hydroxamate transport system substrate-binding protein
MMRPFGFTLCLASAVALVATACGSVSEVNQPAASSSQAAATSSSATAKVTAHVGATLTLTDEQVTLTKVIDPATGADQYTVPDTGKRFVATVFTIKNTASQAGQGDANSNTSVIGSDNQGYSPDFSNVSECTNFNDGSFELGPGESVSGCVVFQLPTGVTVAKVQWSPSSGFSGDFAEWLVP